ncbi:phage tail sheath subtilisin-like domain-containing protein [Novosphingobium aquae]|uniref:Phage tail sheath subtilisin-like domain-containing protein n=1 Tax=Novosphingobium aquae TaxID=3133435 RepID=A0ABU8S3Y9_9SPHN
MHGIKVNELTTGTRALKAASTSIIGLVATAGAAVGAPTVALDAAFPVGALTLITNIRAAIETAGTTGTLKAALEAIADQGSPVVVVSRVAVDVDPEDQAVLVEAGVEALLGAQSQLGVTPRILGAPALDVQAVATALAATARKLRGMAYAAAIGADVAAATDYRENFGARELMLLWPATDAAFAGDAVARALGLRSRIDTDMGWHKTLSNVAVDGITGLDVPIFFDINSDDNDAALLNAGDVTTIIRQDGFRFWGNRTCSDEPLFAFESAVRTAQVLQDEMASGLLWAIDKPLTAVLIRDIIETINANFRRLIGQGRLIGAKAWYDSALNTEADLAAGKLVIDYDFTPCSPLESLSLNQRITDRYYASFADLVG